MTAEEEIIEKVQKIKVLVERDEEHISKVTSMMEGMSSHSCNK